MGSWWTKIVTRWASVQGPGKDDLQMPRQQVLYHGKVADCAMVFPYGMHANVDGNSLMVMFAMGGDSSDRAGIPTSMTRRSKLASGEVEVYNPVTRSRVTFKANGDVQVDAKGNITATATGTATINASAATINAPTTINGDVQINGNLTVTGDIVGGNISTAGTLSQGGTDVGGSHVHSGVQSGSSNSGPVV